MNIIRLLNEFNKKFAIVITNAVGTMWCAYAFTALTLVSLPEAIHGGVASLITWIAQTFLQLVLLSIIMVGQSVLSEKSELRAEQDHATLQNEFKLLKDMHQELFAEFNEIKQLHTEVHVLISELNVKVTKN